MSLSADKDKAVIKLHSHGLYCEVPPPRGDGPTIKMVVFTGIIHSIVLREKRAPE